MKLMKNHEGGIVDTSFMILHELHVDLLFSVLGVGHLTHHGPNHPLGFPRPEERNSLLTRPTSSRTSESVRPDDLRT